MTSPVVFVTANQSKHREVQRLLAGMDVRWQRLDLARPEAPPPVSGPASDPVEVELDHVVRARAAEAYRRLGVPCIVENTALSFYDHDDAPGIAFKRVWRELGEDGFAARFGGARGIARVAVAYADGPAPEGARTFTGAMSGTLLAGPRGEGGYGYDRLWLPDGYDRTFAEMADSTYLVNMRAAPYLELSDHLRREDGADDAAFTGTFEAHVTVADGHGARFAEACKVLGVKCVAIELPDGETRSQPMTASFHHGPLLDVQREVVAIAQELVRRGFDVTRTKIEAHGRLLGAPETDEEARRAPSTSYFEFHVKLALPGDTDLEALGRACKTVGAHLSVNAFKAPDAKGMSERFVTMRAYAEGRRTAEARFAELCALLVARGHVIRNRIREYAVFDTNVTLDRGWLPA